MLTTRRASCPLVDFKPTCSQSVPPLSPSYSFSHRQLRSQLSLVVIARMLDQQETLPLWQEKAQVSLGLSRAASTGPRKPVGEQRALPKACLLLRLFSKVGVLRPGEPS